MTDELGAGDFIRNDQEVTGQRLLEKAAEFGKDALQAMQEYLAAKADWDAKSCAVTDVWADHLDKDASNTTALPEAVRTAQLAANKAYEAMNAAYAKAFSYWK